MTSKLEASLEVCRGISEEAFASIARRVIRRLGDETALLLPKEEEQAKKALGVSSSQITSVVELCAYLFEQAAYQTQQGDEFEQAATALGLPNAAVARSVWESEAAAYVGRLKARHLIGDRVLRDTTWSTHLRLDTKTAEPTALFKFDVGTDDITVEASHAELAAFFHKLQAIQSTIDGLAP